MDSQLLLASTSSHVQLWRGSEKVFSEYLGVSNVFPTAAKVQTVVTYHHEVASVPLGEVSRESWAAPLYQKQRNRTGLNNWLGCLALWYTSNFNLCILLEGPVSSWLAWGWAYQRPSGRHNFLCKRSVSHAPHVQVFYIGASLYIYKPVKMGCSLALSYGPSKHAQ